MRTNCGPCECPSTACYSLGAALLLAAALTFLIFCSQTVPAYQFTKGFQQSKCIVMSSEFVDDVCCEGDVNKISKCLEGYEYPCAHVSVTYVDDGDTQSAALYDDYTSVYFQSKTAKESQCCYYHCGAAGYSTHEENSKDFLKKYNAINDSIPCYVDPKNHKKVALVETMSSATFGTPLALSVIFTMAGALVCIITYIYSRVVERRALARLDQSKHELIQQTATAFEDEQSRDERSGSSCADSDAVRCKASRPATRAAINVELRD